MRQATSEPKQYLIVLEGFEFSDNGCPLVQIGFITPDSPTAVHLGQLAVGIELYNHYMQYQDRVENLLAGKQLRPYPQPPSQVSQFIS